CGENKIRLTLSQSPAAHTMQANGTRPRRPHASRRIEIALHRPSLPELRDYRARHRGTRADWGCQRDALSLPHVRTFVACDHRRRADHLTPAQEQRFEASHALRPGTRIEVGWTNVTPS